MAARAASRQTTETRLFSRAVPPAELPAAAPIWGVLLMYHIHKMH